MSATETPKFTVPERLFAVEGKPLSVARASNLHSHLRKDLVRLAEKVNAGEWCGFTFGRVSGIVTTLMTAGMFNDDEREQVLRLTDAAALYGKGGVA